MGSDRSDHRDRVELFVRNQAEVIGRRARRRITPRHRRETRLIDVANPSQLGAVILGKVAQQIRTPITASDYAYADRTHGTERIASIRGKGNRCTRLSGAQLSRWLALRERQARTLALHSKLL